MEQLPKSSLQCHFFEPESFILKGETVILPVEARREIATLWFLLPQCHGSVRSPKAAVCILPPQDLRRPGYYGQERFPSTYLTKEKEPRSSQPSVPTLRNPSGICRLIRMSNH
ncbi:hypothetical protein Anapl_06782 [Anas platyrhynchos]|uniref:Uncharacterized protein n=1 Tax=Anas platyrhynchos TaxID=8839 RepID=R0LJB5_ANAPL|nr:hypothetical protein Anapl_06782 [Anas platyrhynchos]